MFNNKESDGGSADVFIKDEYTVRHSGSFIVKGYSTHTRFPTCKKVNNNLEKSNKQDLDMLTTQ